MPGEFSSSSVMRQSPGRPPGRRRTIENSAKSPRRPGCSSHGRLRPSLPAGIVILQRTRTTTIRRLERDGPCAMWRMSNIEAVIFVAVVALMLALALWAT
jgi:hypothetical protein